MKQCLRVLLGVMLISVTIPATAQSTGGLHAVLEQVYADMMPLCSRIIGVGQAIAGFGAIWYIAYRVWRHIANAEPIDFYPLFRPFVLGLAILLFPSVLALINGVMQPAVTATGSMVKDSDRAIQVLLQKKQEAIKNTMAWQAYIGTTGMGDRDIWYKYTHPDDPTGANEGFFDKIGNDIRFQLAQTAYTIKNQIKGWMSEVLQLLYEAAALVIDCIRTFFLVVLAILGPLVFGLAVFDGLQHTLTVWLARYINVFLWLPVANIFGGILGKIQEKMIALDISQVQATGDTFFSATDTAYLIFLLIGIVGYFTVPSVANYIVHAGGGNALLYKLTSIFSSTGRTALHTVNSGVGMTADALGGMAGTVRNSMADNSVSGNYFPEKGGGRSGPAQNGYQADKISGGGSGG